ncbi:TraM recognition domain-containing protein [Candidatus Oleimmundimicrobium sp.]|uniref:type IV secretory system conjugative DNA transfer family protein n=1 Tax=Candidatus Oleimmundimicrobium sp. TaxID=3060597 RepID=UPI0027286652|nr:TraM recognition domain-containing protein [Candidatus Oleimmundimicrobium sp.]MDO8886415.1 type IV secretion system DNA-binding domain-containing protein [Candidatus Oleimmundimicrobium sp.]
MKDKIQYLKITLPRDNEVTPFAAEQLFATLHGIHKPLHQIILDRGQEYLSFEIEANAEGIIFFVGTPENLREWVEKQIYAQYTTAEIEQAEEAETLDPEDKVFVVSELKLHKNTAFPIKTFRDFENTDPLAGITSSLTRLNEGEKIIIQLLVKPVGGRWGEKGIETSNKAVGRSGGGLVGLIAGDIVLFVLSIVQSVFTIGTGADSMDSQGGGEGAPREHTETEKMIMKAVEGKCSKLGFRFVLRLGVVAKDKKRAKQLTRNIAASYKQYNIGGLNGFKKKILVFKGKHLKRLNNRSFPITRRQVLNIEELSSLWHMPNKNLGTPGIKWSGAKKAPVHFTNDEGVALVRSKFRGQEKVVRIKPFDEQGHIWVVGKNGTGKTTCLQTQILQHIDMDDGVIVVDYHGDLSETILGLIPEWKREDVYILDLADSEYPAGFNMLEVKKDDFFEPVLVIDEMVAVFRKVFAGSWGPSTDDIFRMSATAVVEAGDATILDMFYMLTNKAYREKVIPKIENPVVKDYWLTTFNELDIKTKNVILNPPLNKIRRFIGNKAILNVIAQEKSTFNIRKIMDEGKILIVNLAKGRIGEDNASLFGGMIVSKIQLESMARVEVDPSKRKPCYVWLDEFQNFSTDGIATMLSESRKYGIVLTLANQFPSQLTEAIRGAVLGNVGTLLCFQLAAEEAENIVGEFEPTINTSDIANLDRFNCYVKLRVDGKQAKPFSGITIPLVDDPDTQVADEVKKLSREKISSKREDVERKLQIKRENIEKAAGIGEKAREIANAFEEASKVEFYTDILINYSPEKIENAFEITKIKMKKGELDRPRRYFMKVLGSERKVK